MHIIVADSRTGLIEITVEGFWDRDHIEDFARDLAVAAAQARTGGQVARVLCDYSRAAIQSQDVVAALEKLIREPETRSHKVAFHTDRTLATMQARRVAAVRDDVAVFADRASALAWLTA